MFERLYQIKPSYLPVVRCPDLRGRLEVAAVSQDVPSEVELLDHVLVPGDGEQLGAGPGHGDEVGGREEGEHEDHQLIREPEDVATPRLKQRHD